MVDSVFKNGIKDEKVLNNRQAWSIAGLIICGGLAVTFSLLRMIIPTVIFVVGALVAVYMIRWGDKNG